jgi:hypothetical protein
LQTRRITASGCKADAHLLRTDNMLIGIAPSATETSATLRSSAVHGASNIFRGWQQP